MSQNFFGSVTLRRYMPLSPADRARQGLRKLSVPRQRYRIRVTDSQIRALVKLGYLWPEECENWTAIRQ